MPAKTPTPGPFSRFSRRAVAAAVCALAAGLSGLLTPDDAAALPPGFEETIAMNGLTEPTQVRFASDGRVFVAEKSGIIKVFDSLTDTTPTTFADLRTNVHNFWDRGLLGMTLDPEFPADPYVYVLYTHDAAIGGTAPRWGTVGGTSDNCATPPGPTDDGCVVSGRLSRLTASGNVQVGPEQVLVEGWCQQYPSHSMGTMEFGADGALYVSAGDGASFNFSDYGQDGNPLNPCGDPPGGVGATLTPPTAEGGALRAQDLRTSGDPVGLNGSILRVDPATGAALPNNPLALDPDLNARRVIAHGFRNPFRFTIRPGTNELWIGDVGWTDEEEIDVIANPTSALRNFGWPCYEGPSRQDGYDAANLNICEDLYAAGSGAVVEPFFHYSNQVAPGETCPTGSASITGLAFYEGGSYPAAYNDALFFTDYSRECIWVMFAGGNGLPDPNTREMFLKSDIGQVDLEIGPGGDLFYVDFDTSTIRRIRYTVNSTPTAVATANPTFGPTPLTVNFDGTASSDPDPGDTLAYAWDLDGDGAFDDSTAAQPSFIYTQSANVTVRLRVTDPQSVSSTASVVISPGNTPPNATIDTPLASLNWSAGEAIAFSGSATDTQEPSLPASAFSWSLILHHCPSDCHTHPVQSFPSVKSGSFNGPDHEYPSHLELKLTVTDARGLTDTESVLLNPRTVDLTFQSAPAGLHLVVGSGGEPTPFTRTVIVGSANSVSAPSPQVSGGQGYAFSGWSDGGAQTHDVVAPATATTYTATFTSTGPAQPGLVAAYAFDEGSGTSVVDASSSGNGGTISGATWTPAGKFGAALSFDGINDWVSVPDSSSLDLTSGMTLEAWVRPTAQGDPWRTVIMKEQVAGFVYDLYASRSGAQTPLAEFDDGVDVTTVDGPTALPLDAWTHLAATYDGAALTLYVNGTEAATVNQAGAILTSTGDLRIGGNSIWTEWFEGLIDEVRIYDRALPQAEIQADMNRSVGAPDSIPPTTPGSLAASGSLSSVALSWSASSDDRGVARYNVHRGSSAGFVPSPGNRVAQPTGTSYTDNGLQAGTYYYKIIAEDGAGNVSPASNEASAQVTGDVSAPTAPTGLTATPGPSSASLAWTGSTDNVAVTRYNVHRGTAAGFTPSAANRIAQPTGTTHSDSGLAAGTYYYRVTAEDAAGNLSAASNEASATVSAPPATGLVAAYGFDEGAGGNLADTSGSGNGGAVTGATWSPQGRFGAALAFDGVNDWVTVPDANSLDLTTGMTLEAWVFPTLLTSWRTVLFKEQTGNLTYGLYGNTNATRPNGQVFVAGTDRNVNGTAPLVVNTWAHLAATYDGAQLRLYVNGTQAGTLAQTGPIVTSTGVLHIGGNAIWNEWFAGRIDEVRIYNRALSAAEIQADMNRSVGVPDSSPPSTPGSFVKTGATETTISTSWTASTDDVGVTGYRLFRDGALAGTTNGTTFTFPALTCGTAYTLEVEAEDAALNRSPRATLSTATEPCDTSAPTAPGSLAANGSLSSVALSWTASTDDRAVTRYNVHRGTTAGFTPSAANRIAQPTGTSHTDTGLAAGTYYYKVTAEDAAGNVSAPSNEATGTVTGDVSAPTAPGSLTATGGSGPVALSWVASTDNVAVARYNVHRSTTAGFTPSAANRIAQPTGTTHSDPGLAAGTYYYRVTAEDAAGNVSPASNEASATVTAAPPSGLVAAYSFDEAAGTTLGDSSGRANNGTITGATWAAAGKTGAALAFDGVNDWVTVPDSASLDLTGGMTLEAWVFPTLLTSWRTVLFKEQTGNLTYGLYANTNTTRPNGQVFVAGTDRNVNGNAALVANTWAHLAATYDGAQLRLFVNGTQAGTLAQTGPIVTSTGVLHIGGNAIWNEWFAGQIDEVRIYSRALSAAEIQTDMNAPVGTPDSSPPTTPGSFVKTGATETTISTSWTASTDNVGVTEYRLYRDGTLAGTTNGTTFTFPGLTCGTAYTLGVEARDAAGNTSPRALLTTSSEPCDTSAPTAPASLAANGSLSSVALTWSASTDNVGVTRYNVHRGTTAGFTPSVANRIAQPTGTSHTDTGLAAGTYYYKVTAEDAAGNVSPPSNEATGTVTGDVSAPTAPANLAATGGLDSVSLTWSASTDNVAVSRYNVHRGTTAGFTPSVANRIAQPAGTSYSNTSLAPGTYYYKVTAEDAAGNVSPASNEASAAVTGDVTPPGAPTSLVASPSGNAVALTWTAPTDNVGVTRYNVHRSTAAGFTPSAANRIAQPTGPSHSDPGLAAGTYYYRVTAEDAAGNVSPASNEASAIVTNAPPGLVAAYSFAAGQGTTLADASGNGNTGTITGATWTAAGKFDSALTFDGVNDWVTVPDANSLDLTTAMTLEAWVRPTLLTSWRTVLFKEQTGNLTYGLYGNTSATRPNGQVFVAGTDRNVNGSAPLVVNTWAHLAATYDGAQLRLYVNGTQAGTLAQTGPIVTSTGVLHIGGNAVWNEWFAGQIDEVRIYNRALTAAQIQTDMAASIATPDTTAPGAPSNLAATGGLGKATLSWTAATDNVGVDRYNVHRSTTAGFTPDAANRIAQPTGTSHTDSGRPAGTYFYKVTAQDAAGNVGPASNEANATVIADTTAPTVSISAPAAGATIFDTISVSANASDDDAVAGVQFKLDGVNLGAEDTSAPYSIQWNTRTTANGPHSLTGVARDATGNSATSASVAVTVDNTLAPPPGLVAGYGFDERTGTTAADSSPSGNTGTITGATHAPVGRFGSALSFDGIDDWVTVPDAASLDLTTGMTLSAYVKPNAVAGWRTVIFKESPGNHVYVLYANRNTNVPSGEADVGGVDNVSGTSQLPAGTWSHLALTYDGSALRLYVNGALVGTAAATGAIATSTGVLRIGGNSAFSEWFSGLIDEVRVYNRALSVPEIEGDMASGVARDTRAPQVSAVSPASGAGDVSVTTRVTATFDEAVNPTSLTTTTFELRDSGGTLVPATVSYDLDTGKATLSPTDVLSPGTTYTTKLEGGTSGSRVTDYAGNALAADTVWSFTTEPAPPPILVLAASANGFTQYVPDILRAEGLNAFSTADVSLLSPGLLALFDVVVLGEAQLSASQEATVTTWVNGGGNLIALRPDKGLASLFGLTDAAATLADAYLLVNTSSGPGSGIVGQTIQFHGAADRYTLNGATAVATLYSSATAATANPAVTLRNVGGSGGQAAAFTYDLARSVVLTRQGNPAWAGQDRDGDFPIRPNDLFFGGAQTDWVNVNKINIPQADEQQRLLVNLVEHMNADRKPIPRFWYLPRGEKAAIVMTGDDHAQGGTAARFNTYKTQSPAGCSVANWECVRATSYVYPGSPLTNAQAVGYLADGFEIALHTNVGGGCDDWTPSELDSLFATQRAEFAGDYPSQPAPVSERTHCVAWSDWVSHAEVDLAHGVRLDTNYYHYPGTWIGSSPGYMTGSALVMRFANDDGTPIDVYQAHTHMNDEADQLYPATADALLDAAVGPQGYYGVFTTNMHTDDAQHDGSDAIVASALARSVPVVTAKQMLTWVDGRDASSFKSFSWTGGTLGFTVTAGAGANGLQALLPTQSSAGALSSISRDGSPVVYTTQTIKGISYAVFPSSAGTYAATYGG